MKEYESENFWLEPRCQFSEMVKALQANKDKRIRDRAKEYLAAEKIEYNLFHPLLPKCSDKLAYVGLKENRVGGYFCSTHANIVRKVLTRHGGTVEVFDVA